MLVAAEHGDEIVRHLLDCSDVARVLAQGETKQSGKFGGGLNQVMSDFGLSQTRCIPLIKTPYPYL